MPDANITGVATGGLSAVLVIAAKELIIKWMGRNGNDRGSATIKHIKEAVADHEVREKERAQNLAKETRDTAAGLKEKADVQDIKIKILEHQRDCLSEIKLETKEFQAQILTSFEKLRETLHDSIRRIHDRIDEVVKKG